MENPRVLNIPVTLNGLPPNVHLNDTDLRFIQQELVSAMQPYLNKLSSQIISNLGSSSFQQTSTLSSFGSPLPLQVPSESSSQTCNSASTSASSSLLNPLGVKNSLFNSIASVSPSVVSPLVAPLAVPSADSNAAVEPLSEPNLSEPAEPITQLTPVDAPSDNTTTPASCFSPARTPTPTPSTTPQPASCSYEPLPPVGLLPDVRRSRRKRGPNRLRPFDYSQQSASASEQHSIADSSASASASACVSPAAQAHAYASLEADAGSDPSASASTMRLTVPVQIDIKLPISIGGLNPLQLFTSAAHAATSGSCVGLNSGSAAVSVGHSSALPSAALFSGAGTNTVSGSGVYAGGETARSSASASACASVSATASVISSRCNSRLSNDGPLSVSRMSESRIASRASSIRPDADDATSDIKPFNLKFKTKLPRKPAQQQQQQQQQPKDMNLEELEAFAHYFKARRIDLGFTQADVGAALGKLYGSEFSQTTVSRFEALRLTFNNMVRLQPLLDTWLSHAVRLQQKGLCVPKLERAAGDAEAGAGAGAPLSAAEAVEASIRAENRANRAAAVGEGGEDGEGAEAAASYSGGSDAETASELIDLPGPNRKRKRKRRTTIDGELRMQFEKHYVIEPRPTPSALIAISAQLNVDKEVVRVWFCNRRQRDRRLVDHDMLALNTADPDADAIAAPDAAGSLLSQI